MYNIFYIIFPWFLYLIPLLLLFINYLYKLIKFNLYKSSYSVQGNPSQGNLLLLLIYLFNSLNYYNIYNNLDLIYNGYIINPYLIILFCFILFAFITIIIII